MQYFIKDMKTRTDLSTLLEFAKLLKKQVRSQLPHMQNEVSGILMKVFNGHLTTII